MCSTKIDASIKTLIKYKLHLEYMRLNLFEQSMHLGQMKTSSGVSIRKQLRLIDMHFAFVDHAHVDGTLRDKKRRPACEQGGWWGHFIPPWIRAWSRHMWEKEIFVHYSFSWFRYFSFEVFACWFGLVVKQRTKLSKTQNFKPSSKKRT